jgi:hypothetical protein
MGRNYDAAPSTRDALRMLCEDLILPVEKLANIVYLASRSGSDTRQGQHYLHLADEMLADLREQLMAQCGPTTTWRRNIS